MNPLSIRERNGQVFVEGLSKIQITNVNDLEEVLVNGDLNRKTASTNMNDTSSRSHAALIITIIMKEEEINGVISYRESTLVIVDLAGYLCLIGRVYVFYVGHVDRVVCMNPFSTVHIHTYIHIDTYTYTYTHTHTLLHCNILSKHHHYQGLLMPYWTSLCVLCRTCRQEQFISL
jgi:hypothetical protein